jgi:TolB-like protein
MMGSLRTLLFAAIALPAAALAAQAPLAVAEFDYTDGSGEVVDQRAVHAERLKLFAESLRADLGKTGDFRIVALDCSKGCGSDLENLDRLSRSARERGARFLIFGQIHKQSTLIQWLKAELVDLEHDQVVLDRYLTFRGDSDDAWRHAEAYLAKEMAGARLN